jgi:beta-lactamase class A
MVFKSWLKLACGIFAIAPAMAIAADTSHPTMRDGFNRDLQQLLQQRVADLHLTQAVRDKRLAITLVDVTDANAPRVAQVNGDEMMYAASLPKIAVLLAAFERIKEGKLALNDKTREVMTNMIRYSSNRAASEIISKVGKNYINKVLTSPKYRLYDPQFNGGLWVGKAYASGKPAYHRDPIHNLSHGATTMQVARFYYLLETGQLVSPEFSREMKSILSKPGINHKFVKGLMADHPDAQMYRKSGSWRSWHADSALIERNGRSYIAVALAKDPKGGKWMKQLIHEMDEIIFELPEPHADVASADAGESPVSAGQRRSSSSKRLM